MQISGLKQSLKQRKQLGIPPSISFSRSTPAIYVQTKTNNVYCFRKSFFQPSLKLRRQFHQRSSLQKQNKHILSLQIVVDSHLWLLLRCNKISPSFFKMLNNLNPQQILTQVLLTFKALEYLSKIYGFFKITQKMILVDESGGIKVWINQNIFRNDKMNAIQQGKSSEQQFVLSFQNLLQIKVAKWKKINAASSREFIQNLEERIFTIQAKNKFIERVSHNSQIKTLSLSPSLKFQDLLKKSQSHQNIWSMPQLGDGASKNQQKFASFHPKLNKSFDINDDIQISECKQDKQKVQVFINIECKELKSSIYNANQQKVMTEKHEEIEMSRKKLFPLTSTSSTLEKFCERGKFGISSSTEQKAFLNMKGTEERRKSNLSAVTRKSGGNIEIELQDLFKADGSLIEGNPEELEKIAEEMEQILLW